MEKHHKGCICVVCKTPCHCPDCIREREEAEALAARIEAEANRVVRVEETRCERHGCTVRVLHRASGKTETDICRVCMRGGDPGPWHGSAY